MSGVGPGKTNNPMGRPKGARSRLARENVEAARSTGLLPHEILLSFARGEPQIERSVNPITKEVTEHTIYPDATMRAQCANWCAPYFAPKLAQVQHRGSIGRSANDVSDDELIKTALGDD